MLFSISVKELYVFRISSLGSSKSCLQAKRKHSLYKNSTFITSTIEILNLIQESLLVQMKLMERAYVYAENVQ